MLPLAAALIVLTGLAHSILGERYILTRLFRRPLPPLFGSDDFTRRTLRFAWHLTTVTWFAFAALLVDASGAFDERWGAASVERGVEILGIGSAACGLVALLGSKGRHLSWVVFFAVAALCCAP
ncbi:MAG: hypothetical protein ACYS26_19855 [Planctomycetota bacterium]|jgi:hypothetical protein